MANEIRTKQGTTVTWAASGGTYLLTLTSLATATGRKGAAHDFTALMPQKARWQLKTDFATAPTAGNVMDIYWVSSVDNSVYDGALTAGDGAASDTNLFRKLLYIGTFVCENNATSQVQSGVFAVPARYGFPIVYNRSGQSLSSTATDHEFSITPLIDEVQ